MLALADTSFLYAAVDRNDLNHKKASGFLKDNEKLTYVIPFSTLLQTSNLIGRMISGQAEMVFMENIIKNFNIEMHEHGDIERAFQILEHYRLEIMKLIFMKHCLYICEGLVQTIFLLSGRKYIRS